MWSGRTNHAWVSNRSGFAPGLAFLSETVFLYMEELSQSHLVAVFDCADGGTIRDGLPRGLQSSISSLNLGAETMGNSEHLIRPSPTFPGINLSSQTCHVWNPGLDSLNSPSPAQHNAHLVPVAATTNSTGPVLTPDR